ncbi:MAG TPA: hypothetical protein VHY37_07550 [Tepidisphaeraceae bacterium]|jgi:plastocyanin|nr:hypothetical protein [Tepidisphaeraceae bacterium]
MPIKPTGSLLAAPRRGAAAGFFRSAAKASRRCAAAWRGILYAGFAAILLLTVGCERHASANIAQTAPLPLAENVPGDGTVIGRVTIVDAPPPLPRLDTSATPDGARLHPHGIADESLVIGPGGTVQNVVVSVEGAPMSDGRHEPPVPLDQSGCQYKPHVVAVQIGQPLVVSSHDPFTHNVDMMSVANAPRNLSFPGPGSQTVVFGSPEFFKVRCDIHPSMSAWIAAMPSPYYSLTAKDGTFVIHHVPAGAFTLSAWQERLGTLHQPLYIKAGQTVHLNFVYQP